MPVPPGASLKTVAHPGPALGACLHMAGRFVCNDHGSGVVVIAAVEKAKA
jgi:hypothetical protein